MAFFYGRPMTHDNSRCAVPDCRFAPLPKMNEADELEVSSFCSDACRSWFVNALHNARCEPSPEAERQAQRLFLVKELLLLRDHPTDVDFFTTPPESLGAAHGL